jgi:adenylyltransferase/sulfurtransferase
MGGLGSPAALYLAAAGVGTLGLADFDTVEGHNLQRQILHDTPGIGRPKLDSAIDKLRALNPGVTLVPHPDGIAPDHAEALLADYDLVVDGSDNFATRYLVNDACVLTGTPLIYGSIFQFEGQVSFFHPAGDAPCYRCLFPRPPEPGTVPNCEEAGVFGALCGVVGSLQAMEAIKAITGVGQRLAGRLLAIDALTMSFRTLSLKRDPACPCCGATPEIRALDPERYRAIACTVEPEPPAATGSVAPDALPMEVDVREGKRLIDAGATILDVREPYETAICQIPESLLIPMGRIGMQWESLPKDQPVVVTCHHGMRSLQVTQFLRERGLEQTTSLAGGVDAWAREVERRGAGEILLTIMDADGTQSGYDIEITRAVVDAVDIPVIASGGAGAPEHLAEVLTDGRADAALAASIFHYGRHDIAETKAYLAAHGIPVRQVPQAHPAAPEGQGGGL